SFAGQPMASIKHRVRPTRCADAILTVKHQLGPQRCSYGLSSSCLLVIRRSWGAEELSVDLAGDVSLEAPHRFGFGEPLLLPSGQVGAGTGIPAQSGQRDGVQRGVGLAVAAAIKAMTVGTSGAGRDGCDTAEVGEGGFGAQPGGVVSGGDQELTGDL